MSFSDDIKAFQSKATIKINASISNDIEELFTNVVLLSPTSAVGAYSKDLLNNQWYSDIGGVSSSVSSATSPTGADSIARIKATIAQNPFLGKDNSISLANNLSYSFRAEVLGWPKGVMGSYGKWRGAEPYHMVSKSVDILKAKRI